MEQLFINNDLIELREVQEIPVEFSNFRMEGTVMHFGMGAFGKIFIQQISFQSRHLQFQIYRIKQDCHFRYRSNKKSTGIRIVLKGDLVLRIVGLGNMAFAEARCNLLHLPFVNMDGSLHKGKEYVFLDLNFPPVEIEGVAGVFPFAGAFAEKLQAKTAAALYSQPCSISFALLEMVYAILLAQYPPQVQAAYLQIKAAELLFEVLLLASLHQAAGEKQTVQQYTSLVEARNFIETHFDEHLTIRKIAKKFGMNSTSFKTGFKQEFGMGAYEFLVRTRMTKASKMLKERKLSIQQIGLALGYSSGGSFIRVYKRYFKQTPLQMRKLLL